MERAWWVVRDKITTAHAIEELLANAVTRGVRDLIVQVRGRGDAYYRSDLEPRAEGLEDAELDPLAKLVRDGAVVGVRIHAWGTVFFVWSHPERALPRSERHLVNAHPERPSGSSTMGSSFRQRGPTEAIWWSSRPNWVLLPI